ncbi:MAG: TPM domain-containing protein [Actinomycetaceae bacterium]|nr:TPM domain-containing protein [Actinomycetaceae bacterium]
MTKTQLFPANVRRAVGSAVLCLLLFLIFWAYAAPTFASTEHVVDEVDVLSSSEEQQLEDEIQRISSTYREDIVIYFTDLNGRSPMNAADDYFDENGYGIGGDYSGVLLLIAPDSRDMWISTRGDSIRTFNDEGISRLLDRLRSPLGDDDWYGGAKLFVEETEVYMKAADSGTPVGTSGFKRSGTSDGNFFAGFISIVVALFGGGGAGTAVAHFVFVRKMRNEGYEPTARTYLVEGSAHIEDVRDTLINRNIVAIPKPKTSSGSGFSSTHTSSSGATHGGGGGKF